MNYSCPLRRRFIFFMAIVIAACLAALTQAQSVPALVNYQGRLANPDGSAIATADYQLTFKVYDAATNGALVWGPQIFDGIAAQGHGAKVPVVQGYFNVMLGPVDINGVSLANAFSGTNRFVEVTVSNRPPIAPRQQILTTPFAFNSAKLAGADWSAVFGTNDPVNGRIPSSKLGAGSISITNLAAREVGTNVGVGGLALSLSSGLFQSSSSSYVDVNNYSVGLVTTGRPVIITLTPDLGGDNGGIQNGYINLSSSGNCEFLLFRNGVATTKTFFEGSATGAVMSLPGGAITFLDTPLAGTNTYKLQVKPVGATITVRGLRLTAYEL